MRRPWRPRPRASRGNLRNPPLPRRLRAVRSREQSRGEVCREHRMSLVYASGKPPPRGQARQLRFFTYVPSAFLDMDFAIMSPLVRPRLPLIRFLFIRSRVSSTLPSNPAWRRRPCASLTFTSIRLGRGLSPPSCRACSAHPKRMGARNSAHSSVTPAG